MNNSVHIPTTRKVSGWARLLALLFLLAFIVAAYGAARAWLISGQRPFEFPGVLTCLLLGYVTVAIGWAGVTGKVPRLFPIGAMRWARAEPPC